jgi:hypothetical protein
VRQILPQARHLFFTLLVSGCAQQTLSPTSQNPEPIQHTKHPACSPEQWATIKKDLGLSEQTELPADLFFSCD